MICNQCKSRNPIGGKFCRECGTALPLPENPLVLDESMRAERERLNERVASLLSAAYTLAEQRRYDQALPLTEEAALLLPNSTAALSLLATLYEYAGEDEKSIRAMERVVALNPESPGDRQKLGQLRRAFQQAQSNEPFPHRAAPATGSASSNGTPSPAPPRAPILTPGAATRESLVAATIRRSPWIPWVVGCATTACVLGLGLSLAQGRQHPVSAVDRAGISPAGGASAIAAGTSSSNLGTAATPLPASVTSANPVGLNFGNYPANADPFVNSAINAHADSGYHTNAPIGGFRLPGRSSYVPVGDASGQTGQGGQGTSSLPNLQSGQQGNPQSSQQALAPIIAVAPGTNNAASANALGGSDSRNGFGAGSRLTVGPPSGSNNGTGSGTTGGAPGTDAENAGGTHPIIRISLGEPNSRNSGSTAASNFTGSTGSTAATGGSSSSPLARARGLQVAKRYSDAIGAYHDAISADNSVAGTAQQGIAQCEAAQGREVGARSAYREALQAYEAQLVSGHNVVAAQTGIAACKAALEAYGNGN